MIAHHFNPIVKSPPASRPNAPVLSAVKMPKGWEFYLSGQGQDSVQFGILHFALWLWVDNTPVLRRQNPNHAVFMFGQQPSFYKLIISPSHLLPLPDPNSYPYP